VKHIIKIMTVVLTRKVTESYDVDLHVSRVPKAGSHNQITLMQVHTIALPLKALLE